jgi:6-phosphogluconolactonase
LHLTVAVDATAAAIQAAQHVARCCAEAVARRGAATIALSGGETPWVMLAALRELDVPWTQLHVAQVDERIAPDGGAERNLTRLAELLVSAGPLAAERLLSMPVTSPDLPRAAANYQQTLERVTERPIVLDLVHLGLGADGHTASLVPGDPVTDVVDHDVAIAGEYQGHRRMTLTLPVLARARERLWLVTGASKRTALAELLAGRGTGPGARLPRERSFVFADRAASST